MGFDEYKVTLYREFAKYGFVACPLLLDEIRTLWARGISVEDGYGVGCDVEAGLSFGEAFEVLLQHIREYPE